MSIPHLHDQHGKKMFVVRDQPFLVLGGEIHNSTSSSYSRMEKAIEKALTLGLNTLLVPVTWELMEPEEGRFDFSQADMLLELSRKNGLHLILLWFGSWKNAECMYAPAWVKKDLQRFRRGQIVKGENKSVRKDSWNMPYTTLSRFCRENWQADSKAFAALMRHLKETDAEHQTVIAVQVENETGLLGAAREMSNEADSLFAQHIPAEMMAALGKPEQKATWTSFFGEDSPEAFTAWYTARYVEQVASAGKAAYPLPMAVNCWLNKPGDLPGKYPSGGPIVKTRSIWKAAAPSIDLYGPDIYVPNFCDVCDEYTATGDALFIPESATHSYAGPRLAYAIGHYYALCCAPFGFEEMGQPFGAVQSYLFGVDVTDPALKTPQDTAWYAFFAKTLESMKALLLSAWGTKDLQAVISERPDQNRIDFDGFSVQAIFQHPMLDCSSGVCLALRTGENECLILAQGCGIAFLSNQPDLLNLDLLSLETGCFENGQWHTECRLNGDEGAFLAFREPILLRAKVFCYA